MGCRRLTCSPGNSMHTEFGRGMVDVYRMLPPWEAVGCYPRGKRSYGEVQKRGDLKKGEPLPTWEAVALPTWEAAFGLFRFPAPSSRRAS
jgi:hypothetical protein